jgi:processive 1,2-diacylglycerol beta-glucosyltransferase
LNEKQIAITGLPMRKSFFESHDKESLKRQYAIEKDKPVIVLMMGGQVKPTIVAFAKELAKLQFPAHLIFCVSKNEKIKNNIKKIIFAQHVSVTILGYTEHVSELLTMADLLITKSGSASFAEGLTMKVPMIMDATETLLYWERFNHTLLTTHGWGKSLNNINQLNRTVTEILGDEDYYQEIKSNLEKFPKQRFDQEIKPLVTKLIAQTTDLSLARHTLAKHLSQHLRLQ